jgi:hypothetical protein
MNNSLEPTKTAEELNQTNQQISAAEEINLLAIQSWELPEED